MNKKRSFAPFKQILSLWHELKKNLMDLITSLASLVKSGYRSNAFAPLVWFNAIANTLLIFGILKFEDRLLKMLFTIIICFIILCTVIAYFVLLFKDPKLLQSERFRLEDKRLDLIESKGEGIVINPVDLTTPPMEIEGGVHG